jgi:hypothetical protein
MFRARLASVALAAGIGLVSGCSSDFSLRDMFHHKDSSVCCTPDCPTCCGDVGTIEGPILAPPDAAVVVPPPPIPPVVGAPRLVPAPATPMPYTP